MTKQQLESVAQALVRAGKGLLAADESAGTIKRRFDSINLASTEESRRAYRELLLTTPGIEEFISGVILFDETISQKTQDGSPFPEMLSQKGILPGIKVDKGAVDLAGFPGEMITEGLDGLRGRLLTYHQCGARFAKWRAVITIHDALPSRYCIDANAHVLARYASVCQEVGMVPIVEPEVLMEGNHTIERCEEVTAVVLSTVFSALQAARVALEGMLLKPNMVLSGRECGQQAGVDEVAETTVRCLRRVVPAAVPGIVFLSGGQGPELATERLNAMNTLGGHPWQLSFSYARALQEPALRAWKGQADNVPLAQQIFHHRAKCNSAARYGKYSKQMEVTPVFAT